MTRLRGMRYSNVLLHDCILCYEVLWGVVTWPCCMLSHKVPFFDKNKFMLIKDVCVFKNITRPLWSTYKKTLRYNKFVSLCVNTNVVLEIPIISVTLKGTTDTERCYFSLYVICLSLMTVLIWLVISYSEVIIYY